MEEYLENAELLEKLLVKDFVVKVLLLKEKYVVGVYGVIEFS